MPLPLIALAAIAAATVVTGIFAGKVGSGVSWRIAPSQPAPTSTLWDNVPLLLLVGGGIYAYKKGWF